MVEPFTLECTCAVRKSKRNGSELRDIIILIVQMASAGEERGKVAGQFALVNKLVPYHFL
jgi:hypothetical protein